MKTRILAILSFCVGLVCNGQNSQVMNASNASGLQQQIQSQVTGNNNDIFQIAFQSTGSMNPYSLGIQAVSAYITYEQNKEMINKLDNIINTLDEMKSQLTSIEGKIDNLPSQIESIVAISINNGYLDGLHDQIYATIINQEIAGKVTKTTFETAKNNLVTLLTKEYRIEKLAMLPLYMDYFNFTMSTNRKVKDTKVSQSIESWRNGVKKRLEGILEKEINSFNSKYKSLKTVLTSEYRISNPCEVMGNFNTYDAYKVSIDGNLTKEHLNNIKFKVYFLTSTKIPCHIGWALSGQTKKPKDLGKQIQQTIKSYGKKKGATISSIQKELDDLVGGMLLHQSYIDFMNEIIGSLKKV